MPNNSSKNTAVLFLHFRNKMQTHITLWVGVNLIKTQIAALMLYIMLAVSDSHQCQERSERLWGKTKDWMDKSVCKFFINVWFYWEVENSIS